MSGVGESKRIKKGLLESTLSVLIGYPYVVYFKNIQKPREIPIYRRK